MINPKIGHLPITAITLAHALEAMRNVPADASPHTRRHYAKIVRRCLELARFPRARLRRRTVSAIRQQTAHFCGARSSFGVFVRRGGPEPPCTFGR